MVPSAKSVTDVRPDFAAIAEYPVRGVIVTGIAPPESGFDFYSRFFAPMHGINEVIISVFGLHAFFELVMSH